MDEASRTQLSKFLSYVLRHKPQAIGIALDREGWIEIEALLRQCRASGREVTRAMLEEVVATSPKRRFAISQDGLRLRANQGHTVQVEIVYEEAAPPEVLFHGTVARFLEAIRARGLDRTKRHHVHLSADSETARAVGARRGKPVVLRVLAGNMHRDGHAFFLSANGVWLTAAVPPAYLEFPDS